jgi:hypothetical protein
MTTPNEKMVRGKEKSLCSNKHKIGMGKSKLTGKYHGQVFNSRCGHSNTLTFVVNKIMNCFIQSLNKCWIKRFLTQNFFFTV